MKKFILISLLSVMTFGAANAQEFTKFKFETGLLYGIPSDKAYDAGIGYYMHPSYYLNDQINVGLKAEWAVIAGADVAGKSVSVSAIGSYLLTSNYYFSTGKVRPYAGLGLGIYSLGSYDGGASTVDFDDDNQVVIGSVDYGSKFGVAPTVGLDMGHFTINLAYNAIMGIDSELPGKNYLSFGIGAFFGGGKK